jgi:hypothetical protein
LKFALSSTVSLMAKYVHKRPDSSQFQFVLRVPEDLLHRYPKSPIRYSLKTDDPVLAAKRGEAAYARHQAEFARLRGDSTLIPEVYQGRSAFIAKTGVTEGGKLHVATMTAALKSSSDELDAVTILRVAGRNVLIDCQPA